MNLERIVGSNFYNISRAADMMCLGIGEEIDFINYKGRTVKRPQYGIHLQCPWRLFNDSGILLGSYDVYEPYNKSISDDDWSYDICGRPDDESSVFDVTLKMIIPELINCKIIDCSMSKTNDLLILFSNGWSLETFITSSKKQKEFWRFIEFETDTHTIIYDLD